MFHGGPKPVLRPSLSSSWLWGWMVCRSWPTRACFGRAIGLFVPCADAPCCRLVARALRMMMTVVVVAAAGPGSLLLLVGLASSACFHRVVVVETRYLSALLAVSLLASLSSTFRRRGGVKVVGLGLDMMFTIRCERDIWVETLTWYRRRFRERVYVSRQNSQESATLEDDDQTKKYKDQETSSATWMNLVRHCAPVPIMNPSTCIGWLIPPLGCDRGG
jgi:hypothetical protein